MRAGLAVLGSSAALWIAVAAISVCDYAPGMARAESVVDCRQPSGLANTPGNEKSMAASSREIDRADKRNRNQKNDGSQQRVDDHIPLRKSYYRRCTAVSKDTAYVFKGLQWIRCAEKSPKADNCGHQPATTEYWNSARGNCSGFRF